MDEMDRVLKHISMESPAPGRDIGDMQISISMFRLTEPCDCPRCHHDDVSPVLACNMCGSGRDMTVNEFRGIVAALRESGVEI
jgi:hypothetical protein